jgi:hypothetical protein
MYPLKIIKNAPSVYLNWLLLKKLAKAFSFEGRGALAGFFTGFVIFFAIRLIIRAQS